MSVLSPVTPEHIASEKLIEPILFQEVGGEVRYPIHSHHWGLIQIHVSSFSTKLVEEFLY